MMRPQDRRALVADAADIRRFEARLAEIESDLNQTQQNALRVSAVAAEVKPQLDRLKVQAERAQRHQNVRDEVERLAAAWYGERCPAKPRRRLPSAAAVRSSSPLMRFEPSWPRSSRSGSNPRSERGTASGGGGDRPASRGDSGRS